MLIGCQAPTSSQSCTSQLSELDIYGPFVLYHFPCIKVCLRIALIGHSWKRIVIMLFRQTSLLNDRAVVPRIPMNNTTQFTCLQGSHSQTTSQVSSGLRTDTNFLYFLTLFRELTAASHARSSSSLTYGKVTAILWQCFVLNTLVGTFLACKTTDLRLSKSLVVGHDFEDLWYTLRKRAMGAWAACISSVCQLWPGQRCCLP